MPRPDSIAALAALVPDCARISIRGAGTKPGLAPAAAAVDGTPATVVDVTALSGVVEYTPEECTFTALAGTPVRDIEDALRPHGHHLPFDPPFAAAGATIGGTVAAGINGSCRYRFGGIRDFIIGATFVDGRGRVLHSGGKVVKNAAGFLVHQALVGSCGSLAILAELTFKVFPAAEAHATVRVARDDLASALTLITKLQRTRIDLEALDLEPPSTVVVRLGGFHEALPERIAALSAAIDGDVDVLQGADDARTWRDARELAWAPAHDALVRVPVTPDVIARLDGEAARLGAARRYTIAGNLAWLSMRSEAIAPLHDLLSARGLAGQVIRGSGDAAFIGSSGRNAVETRLRQVLDPDGRFAPTGSVATLAATE